MTYIMTFLIVAASAVLWRVRGGLFKEYVPANKVWFAVFFGAMAWFFRVGTAEYALCAALACYAGYQVFGWGLYIGRLLGGGELKPNLSQYRECELIDGLSVPVSAAFRLLWDLFIWADFDFPDGFVGWLCRADALRVGNGAGLLAWWPA